MSSFDLQRQESLKRIWHERRLVGASSSTFYNKKPSTTNTNKNSLFMQPSFFNEELVAAVVPPVTVVLEGRSICQRISLHKHGSYQSLAMALRQMFVDIIDHNFDHHNNHNNVVDLTNAVPGHVIAYEDMENDLLLVGDLNWKDFVRVAKRIRILPAKAKSRKQKEQFN